ncbi:MAG: hypothetical protein JW829_09125, partial [Pirellulales bacterium]|nr:hypothetical protein [Pirellulales bacterium]
MRSTTRMVFFALVAAAGAILANGDAATAQPLVTGDLTLYYDFDEIFSNEFLDESGNNFHGTIHEGDPFTETNPGTLTIEATNMVRGAGAARFTQSLYSIESPVYVDV